MGALSGAELPCGGCRALLRVRGVFGVRGAFAGEMTVAPDTA